MQSSLGCDSQCQSDAAFPDAACGRELRKTPESVATFYGEQDGHALIDERNYPPAVRAHLRWKAEGVVRHAPRHALVVEIGCMDGRLHAERLVGMGVG